jgi:Arc/MetJ-type ribon-helix-helix transcriptional regulator
LFSLVIVLSFSLDSQLDRCYSSHMAILLSPDLDARVQEKMHHAGYPSPDEVIREALDALDAKEQVRPASPVAEEQPSSLPIWEQFEQAGLTLPESVLAALPSDGASEHDHYIYGTPKHRG